ncbi:MAG TPA: RidA family protein [Coprothermobacter sp.]|nr:RidA family protein [Coprothermobacter sp.]
MKVKRYVVEGIFRPTGPYVHAVESRDFVFVSGLLGAMPDGSLPEDPDTQLSQMFDNVSKVLSSLGINKEAVLKTTVFMKDMSYATKLNEQYAHFFGSDFPARSMIQVAGLPMNAFFEMELIALRSE